MSWQRSATAAAFNEPDRICRRPDPGEGGTGQTSGLVLHQADEGGGVVDGVPAVLGMRAVHGLAVEDDVEVELPVTDGEHLAVGRLTDDDPVGAPLARRFPGAQGAHLLVDDSVESKAPARQDA